MTNVVGGAGEAGATTAARSAAPSAEPPRPPEPDPQAVAAHVAAGGSPFDLVERPNWFSYSSFDTFERCPRQYAFRYLCRLPAEQARPAADFGTAAHGAFEAFTRERRERLARGEQPPTRADLDLYFEAAWAKTSLSAEADAETWHQHAKPMLDRFWAAELAAEPETVSEEVRFRLDLTLDPNASAVVTGFIDRIDRLPSGAVELIDYKSSSATSPVQAERSLQLSIYALACRDALDLGRPERVTLYCVDDGRRCSAERTDAVLDALRDDLAGRVRAIRGGDFAPTPSPRSCGWWDFTGLCAVRASSRGRLGVQDLHRQEPIGTTAGLGGRGDGMSDEQRRDRPGLASSASPLENSITEALATAIRHDPRPFVRALRDVPEWKEASGAPSMNLKSVERVTASTQVYIQAIHAINAPNGREGLLDLVVKMRASSGEVDIAWVEVKIDAPESKDQLTVYLEHRAALSRPQPFLMTLTQGGPIDSRVTDIRWADLAAAVEEVGSPDPEWRELVAILRAGGVLPPVPATADMGFDEYLPVFHKVNDKIKALWTKPPKPLHFSSGLDKAARGAFQSQHRMYVTAGPITYGLRPAGDTPTWWTSGWEWWIAVGTGSAYHNVWVKAKEVLTVAEEGGLLPKWGPAVGNDAVLERQRSHIPDASKNPDVIEWLSEALTELHDKGVLEPYHQALRTKIAKASEPQIGPVDAEVGP